MHFHPVVLRLFLEAFSFARRLVLAGACSDPVHTLSAILAGGSFATDAMFIVLMGPCDQLLVEHPQASLCLFVDDLTIHVQAANEAVVAILLQEATDSCIALLEGEIMAKVSRGSTWQIDKAAKTIAIGQQQGS